MKPEQYDDALLLVRIFDKQMRIATSKEALGESPYMDIAGYGILGAAALSLSARMRTMKIIQQWKNIDHASYKEKV